MSRTKCAGNSYSSARGLLTSDILINFKCIRRNRGGGQDTLRAEGNKQTQTNSKDKDRLEGRGRLKNIN